MFVVHRRIKKKLLIGKRAKEIYLATERNLFLNTYYLRKLLKPE
jgi:hypothetical protein